MSYLDKIQLRNSILGNAIYMCKVQEKDGYGLASDVKKDVTEMCKTAIMSHMDSLTDKTVNKKGVQFECELGTLTWERKPNYAEVLEASKKS